MKFGIGAKNALLLSVMVSATAGSLVYYLSNGSSQIVIKHERGDLGDEAMLRARELQTQLYAIRRVVLNVAHNPALQTYLAAGEGADAGPVAAACRAHCEKEFYAMHLRLEVWQRDGLGAPATSLGVLPEEDQPAAPIDPQDQGPQALGDAQSIVEAMDGADSFEPFLSEVRNITVRLKTPNDSDKQREGEKRRVHAVWCGVRVAAPRNAKGATDRELYVVALVNLDASLPNGENSPLTAINSSPRHLTLLANEPVRGSGNSANGLPTSAGVDLVFLDETKQDALETKLIQRAFTSLFNDRQQLTELDKIVQTMLPNAKSTAIPDKAIRLKTPVWFCQSRPLPDLTDVAKRKAVAEMEKLNVAPGVRIGGLRRAADNIRVLANSEKDLKNTLKKISDQLARPQGDRPRIHVKWYTQVPCDNCVIRYALFPVRSSVMADGLRFYGLAHCAFEDEMEADVKEELDDLVPWALMTVCLVALAGFVISFVFTRPLKKITLAAQCVGRTQADSDPNEDTWRREMGQILQTLPVRRRDEIGVLARAFQQMIGEIVQGHERLLQLNADLDRRVQERTKEIEQANRELVAARDKAHELSRAKDAFLASVSHELRNPLNQVSGFCQLLELTELDEEQLADLNKIKQAGSQLLALINDILDYQKIVMGGMTLEPEQFEVVELMGEVRDAMTFLAEENNVELQVDWTDDVGVMFADKHRLRQVLINLSGNACKFSPDGQVHVHVCRAARIGDAGSDDADGDDLVFTVVDTGRGMTPEEQAKLFTPFTKLSAKQGNRAGTGLGLVISKGFCELMDGSIQLTSEFGKGTTFSARIPSRTPRPATTSPTSSSQLSPGVAPPTREDGRSADGEAARRAVEESVARIPAGRGQTVLVIDDDANVRELMTRFLGTRGFQVQTAAGGIEGLQMAKDLRPAVITLDAIMSDLDGWAVLAALKADEETAEIPVIMVTMVDNRKRGQVMGAAEFLVKPIDWGRLTQVLRRYTWENADGSILVVDDDPFEREVMSRNLQRDGWKVLEAKHGGEALKILENQKPAAILLDLIMPVMDGFEFLDRFSQSVEFLSIPVIVVTAKDPTPEDFERLNGLAARVLQKGQYSQEEFLREIHRRVDKHIQLTPVTGRERQDA